MASIKAYNKTITPYFSDNTTNKVHTYLFYSNYEFNKTIYNSDSYNVNLFCLVQIAKLLYEKIQKKTHNTNIGFKGSVKSFGKSFNKSVSESFSNSFSSKSNKTKKQKNNNNNNNNNKNKNNKNKTKQSLITKLNNLLSFIIEKLQTKQNYSNSNEYNQIVNGFLKNLESYIKNPIFFNQNLFGNKKINLNFIESDIDIDEQVLEIGKIEDLLVTQRNIVKDFEEIKDIDLTLQYTKLEKENTDRKNAAKAAENKKQSNEEYERIMQKLQAEANAKFMSKMSNRLKRLKKK